MSLARRTGKTAHLKPAACIPLRTSPLRNRLSMHSARCGMSIQTIIDFLIPHLRLFLGRKCVEIDQIDIIR